MEYVGTFTDASVLDAMRISAEHLRAMFLIAAVTVACGMFATFMSR